MIAPYTIPCLDMRGREIKAGDTIAYGLIVGRSANLAIYRVDDVVFQDRDSVYMRPGDAQWSRGPHRAATLKVTKLEQSYGGMTKPSTISMLERALVINETAETWK